jgi:menaquinol-cytochrome c reductase iron-sulfur subunit
MMERRKLLEWVVRGVGASTAGVVGAAALVTLASPNVRERRGPSWRSLGPISEFEIGTMHEAVLRSPDATSVETGVYVWAESPDQFVVFSRACTDLGCPVRWDHGSQWFFCPCHGGIFDRRGEPRAGPPAVPLYRYQTRIRAGILEVDLLSVPPAT